MGELIWEDGFAEILGVAAERSEESVYLLNPGVMTMNRIIDTLDADWENHLKVLAAESVLKDVTEDFEIASRIADLENDGVLALRQHPESAENAALIADDLVIALLATGSAVYGVGTTAPAIVEAVRTMTIDQWRYASGFSHRTPPRNTVRATLAEEIGATTQEDFEAMVETLDTVRGADDGLDEVAISLLVAARNGVLLYDISKWGEDVGLASKATFSRTKSRLEAAGLIDTEKVPIEVGRPRLRLVLAEPELREASIEELTNAAIAHLASS